MGRRPLVLPDAVAAKAAALAGAGIAWLPDFLAADALATGTLDQVPGLASPGIETWARRGADAGPAAGRLLDHLSQIWTEANRPPPGSARRARKGAKATSRD